jgi:hypothetical protein
MRKLPEVELAKSLMTEAQDWSLWRWLFEKSRVRQAADAANAARAAAEERVKSAWADSLKSAYDSVDGASGRRRRADAIDPDILETARQIRAADEEAERVGLDAEATFDEADRRMSASMARDRTYKAIEAWALREKSIRKAEIAGRKSGKP